MQGNLHRRWAFFLNFAVRNKGDGIKEVVSISNKTVKIWKVQ